MERHGLSPNVHIPEKMMRKRLRMMMMMMMMRMIAMITMRIRKMVVVMMRMKTTTMIMARITMRMTMVMMTTLKMMTRTRITMMMEMTVQQDQHSQCGENSVFFPLTVERGQTSSRTTERSSLRLMVLSGWTCDPSAS